MDTLRALGDSWSRTLLAALPRFAFAAVIIVVALVLDERLQQVVERVIGRRREQREVGRLLGRLARIGVLVAGLLLVLSIFKQTEILASFIASLGVVGLILAFALQDITKNFTAGVLLLLQRPFSLDDRIKAGAFEGVVTDMTLRAIALRTNDGHEVLIPNVDVYNGAITNLTRYPQRRLAVAFTVPATTDTAALFPRIEAMLRTVVGGDDAKTTLHPAVLVTSVGKDDINCEAQLWFPATKDDTRIASAVRLRLRDIIAHPNQT